MPKGFPLNLTGQTFGRLIALEFHSKTQTEPSGWKCKCSCGRISVVRAGDLTNGTTKSCGCFRRESQKHKIIDLSGQIFGKLSVLSMSDKKTSLGGIKYDCKCICGNTITTRGGGLTSGNTRSCGCGKIRSPKFSCCAVLDCDSKTFVHGLCRKHSQRVKAADDKELNLGLSYKKGRAP